MKTFCSVLACATIKPFFPHSLQICLPQREKKKHLCSKSSPAQTSDFFPLTEFTQIVKWMSAFASFFGNSKMSRFLMWSIYLFESDKVAIEVFKIAASA